MCSSGKRKICSSGKRKICVKEKGISDQEERRYFQERVICVQKKGKMFRRGNLCSGKRKICSGKGKMCSG